MSAFLDTSFVLAFLNDREPMHGEALRLSRIGQEGQFGALLTSDFVYDETVSVALRKMGAEAARRADAFFKHPAVAMHRLGANEFDAARTRFLARLDDGLSLTDWTIVVQCEALKVGTILSFDKGFDKVYSRNRVPGA